TVRARTEPAALRPVGSPATSPVLGMPRAREVAVRDAYIGRCAGVGPILTMTLLNGSRAAKASRHNTRGVRVMDIEIEAPVDDLEVMFEDEDDAMLGDAAPTNTCTRETC